MKITREECYDALRKIIVKNANDKKWLQENKKELQSRFDLPEHVAIDLLTKTSYVLDDQMLYCLADVLTGNDNFTPREIEMYSKYKYTEHKIKLPLVFDVVKIADDMYTAATTAKELQRFSEAKIVRYNEKTQRPKKIKNGKFQIQLNLRSVNKMVNRFLNKKQIPNYIALNIPDTADWYYDENEKQLVVTDIDAFDIVDGYHRWVSLMKCMLMDPTFDYPMGLQITAFPVEKAQEYVYQEDQKNKLSVIDSKFLNPESPANQIVSMLRRGILDNGIFGDQYIASAINTFYINKDKKYKKAELVAIRNKIYDFIEEYSFKDPDILEQSWSIGLTYCIVAASTLDKAVPYKHVVKCSQSVKDKTRYTRDEINKILEEVAGYER